MKRRIMDESGLMQGPMLNAVAGTYRPLSGPYNDHYHSHSASYILSTAFLLLLVLISQPVMLYPTLAQRLENDDGLRVGDRFHLIISGDIPLRKAIVPDTLTQFTIVQTDVLSNGNAPSALRLTIVPLQLGRLSFPRLRIIPEVSHAESLYTDAFSVNILAVRAEGDTLLRDITAVQRYRLEIPWWAFWTLGIMALAVLVAIVAIQLVGRRDAGPVKMEPQTEEDKRPSWWIAMEALSRLIAEGLLEQGRFVEFHYRLSLILRLFLELEHHFPAMEMTTSEIRDHLRTLSPALSQTPEILDFLQYCDRIKYAKYETNKKQAETRVEWLKHYLLELTHEQKDAETDSRDQSSIQHHIENADGTRSNDRSNPRSEQETEAQAQPNDQLHLPGKDSDA